MDVHIITKLKQYIYKSAKWRKEFNFKVKFQLHVCDNFKAGVT